MFQQGDKARMFSTGGLIGAYTAARMVVFGPVGSYLILFSLVAISLLLSTEVLFTPLLTRSRDALVQRWTRWRAKRRTIKTNLEKIRDEKRAAKEKEEEPDEDVILVSPDEGLEDEDPSPRLATVREQVLDLAVVVVHAVDVAVVLGGGRKCGEHNQAEKDK